MEEDKVIECSDIGSELKFDMGRLGEFNRKPQALLVLLAERAFHLERFFPVFSALR